MKKFKKISILVVYMALAVTTPLHTSFAQTSDDGFEDVVEEGFDIGFYSDNDILYYDPRARLCAYNINDGGINNINMADVPTSFTLGTDNSLRAINLAKQLKLDFSLTDEQAAGVVGNFMHESGGQHLPPDVNEGLNGKLPYAGPPAFHGGYGWAQWTAGRQKVFIDYAVKNGYMGSSAEHATDAANYAYFKYELTNSEITTIPAVAKTATARDAAIAFEDKFERAGNSIMEKRIQYAEKLAVALRTGTGIDTDGSNPSLNPLPTQNCIDQGGGIPTGGSIFENIVFPLKTNKSGIVNRKIFHDGTTERAGHPYIAYDILAKAGTIVVALAEGTVSSVRADGSMGGNVTVYNEAKGLHVYYTHMRPVSGLKTGDKITPGMQLGELLSVNQYPSINADHLHIDAGEGKIRLACSRSNPGGAACNTRVNIGPDLFNGWETLAP